jgi:ABC-type transporter Mla subunit MlaD
MISDHTINKFASKYMSKSAQEAVTPESLPPANTGGHDSYARELMTALHGKLSNISSLADNLNAVVSNLNNVSQTDDGAALKSFGAALAALNASSVKLDLVKSNLPSAIKILNELMRAVRNR